MQQESESSAIKARTVFELSSEKASLFKRISKLDFPTCGLPRRTTEQA
jgi:hypothetical protein